MSLKLYFILIGLIAVITLPIGVCAQIDFDTPISIAVNNNYIKMDSKPVLYNDTTYVPIRSLANALGADDVNWNNSNEEAVILFGNNKIVLPAGEKYGYVDGKYVAIDDGVKLINERVYIPIRFVSHAMGAEVVWKEEYYSVDIKKPGFSVPKDVITYREYTDGDIYWLSRLIFAESQGESMEGKIAVGNVILNRVKSPEFPSTIYNVIFDTKNGVQFTPTANGAIYNYPSGDSIVASKRSLEGESVVGDSLYFLNKKTATSDWIINSRKFNTVIGNHSFYF